MSLTDAGLSYTDVMIIGNEGHGIPSEISDLCTGSVYIPISKKTESLNASVAAAIFMWEQNK
jgi:TrmH family RNA methyltransferase